METKIYTVGQMAELCSITPKQLRYYDKKGLVVPAVRDDHNNYRLYSHHQIAEILMVKEMRQLGVPIERIALLMNSRELSTLHQELDNWLDHAREDIRQAMNRYDKMLELVFRLIKAREIIGRSAVGSPEVSYPIDIVEIGAREIVATRDKGLYSVNFSFIYRRAELYGIIEHYELSPMGPNTAIFHQGYMNQFGLNHEECVNDVETFFVVSPSHQSCPYCRKQEGFRAVSSMHLGSYRNMIQAYQRMENWAKEKGLELSGDSVEEYIVGVSHTQKEEEFLTRILLPLKGYQV